MNMTVAEIRKLSLNMSSLKMSSLNMAATLLKVWHLVADHIPGADKELRQNCLNLRLVVIRALLPTRHFAAAM